MPLIPPHALARKRRLLSPVEQQWSSEVRLVTIAPVGNGHFSAELARDKVVLSSRMPFCDAARVLLDRGADSNSWLVLRRSGSDTDCLRGKVGVIAKLTVAEGDREHLGSGPGGRFFRGAGRRLCIQTARAWQPARRRLDLRRH